MSYFIISLGTVLYFLYIAKYLIISVFIIGLFIALIQNASYIYTALINPGLAVYEPNNINYYDTNRRFCNKCKIYVNSDTTYHCYYCDICIIDHDHHCPWTSKCIGRKNLISFYVFVTSTFVLFLFMFFTGIFSISKN